MKNLNYRTIIHFLLFIAVFGYKSQILSTNPKIHTVFVPGISASTKNAVKYAKAGAFVNSEYSHVIFPDQKKPNNSILNKIIYKIGKKKNKALNRGKIVFGHGHDVVALEKVINQVKASHGSGINGVLFGTCRGGAAIIHYLAEYDSRWVKGIVLDSTYSDPKVMIESKVSALTSKILFPKFNKNVPTPLDAIKRIKNKNIKILMLYAKGDATCPDDKLTPFDQHTKLMYEEFKKQGFDIELASYNAVHCGGIDKEEKAGDRKAYIQTIQNWYKKNGFKE